MGYVGRFAPSPTGPLHLGSLVAALGSFLDAHQHRGRWLLRIEDLDGARVRPGCADEIKRTLERLGLIWDGPVEYQSRRLWRYAEALRQLRSRGLCYDCDCTRKGREDPEAPGCSGRCRDAPRPAGPTAVRFCVAGAKSVYFTDRFQGDCCFDMGQLGDVVVRRRDQVVAYQLAVVVDDHEQGVTDIVRGADLLPSTAWQLLLQRALGMPAPRYGHLPVVVEPDGAKLAKSRRSVPVDPRAGGRALVEALNLLRQSPPGQLKEEPPQAVLCWALEHWNPATLERVQKATAPATTP
jgi:glutamyl-Q tRNA(Asp) synthetase